MRNIIYFLLLLPLFGNAQNTRDTAFQIGGNGADLIYASEKTNDGNLVFAGTFSGRAYISDSLNSFQTQYRNDIFIVKVKQDGSPLWQKVFGGTGDEYIQDIISDKDNNVYVSASFSKSFMIDTLEISGPYSNNSLLLKLNAQGEVIWAKTFESDKGHFTTKMDLDNAGNLYVSGTMDGTYLRIDGEDIIPAAKDSLSAFLLKFNSSGLLSKSSIISTEGGIWITALCVKDNDIYFGGYIGKGQAFLEKSRLNKDIKTEGPYIIKLNSKMEPEWAEFGCSKMPANVNFIHVNKDNSIYFTSTYRDSLIFQNTNINAAGKGQYPFGDLDIAVFKLNESGKEIWHQTYGNKDYDEVNSAAVDQFENIYIASRLSGEITFAGSQYKGQEDGDVLLVKFTSNGSIANIKLSESEFHGIAQANPTGGILIMENGDIYISGWFNSVTTFSGITLNNRSNHDGFIWELSNIATGMNETKHILKQKISLFPNPTDGLVHICISDKTQLVSSINIIDIYGRTVYSVKNIETDKLEILDLKHLPRGTYIMEYSSPVSFSSTKFILH